MDCCKKSGMLWSNAWESVLEQVPLAHLMTANRIGEALGFPTDYSQKIPKQYRQKIKEIAKRDGMTVSEKLEQWIEQDTEPEPEEPEAEQNEEEDIDEKGQLWHQEMVEMVNNHDHQIWFLGAMSKIVQLTRKKVSQYRWLRELRYQT